MNILKMSFCKKKIINQNKISNNSLHDYLVKFIPYSIRYINRISFIRFIFFQLLLINKNRYFTFEYSILSNVNFAKI